MFLGRCSIWSSVCSSLTTNTSQLNTYRSEVTGAAANIQHGVPWLNVEVLEAHCVHVGSAKVEIMFGETKRRVDVRLITEIIRYKQTTWDGQHCYLWRVS